MAAPRRQAPGGTPDRILDVAEALVQVRGYNGFSYAHVAAELDMTTASLHYHFRGKAALGEALIARYSERFRRSLEQIESDSLGARAKLDAYAGLYAQVVRGGRMCLCGILAAEYQTLPPAMHGAIVAFFDANVVWLSRVLIAGRAEGSLAFTGTADGAAETLLAGLEGAMLIARPYGDPVRFDRSVRALVDALDSKRASVA